jgi:hypothetical protein
MKLCRNTIVLPQDGQDVENPPFSVACHPERAERVEGLPFLPF